jgi:hypothetical protein
MTDELDSELRLVIQRALRHLRQRKYMAKKRAMKKRMAMGVGEN